MKRIFMVTIIVVFLFSGAANAAFLYVADSGAGVIHKLSTDGTYHYSFGSGILSNPKGCSIDSKGNLIVHDGANYKVFINEQYLYSFGDTEFTINKADYLTYDENGNIYAPDIKTGSIFVYDDSYQLIDTIDVSSLIAFRPTMNRTYEGPKGIAYDSMTGNLIFTTHWSPSSGKGILVIDTSGNLIKNFASSGNTYNDAAIDSSGNLYVKDTTGSIRGVRVYDSNRNQIKIWLKNKIGNSPNGLAFDDEDNIYVNMKNSYVNVYSSFNTNTPITTIASSNFDTIGGIAVQNSYSNIPPVFEPIENPNVSEGELVQFNVIATDPDGDNVVLSCDNLPEGGSFDETIGLFSWAPNYLQAGNYVVNFTATDDGEPSESTEIGVIITVGNVTDPFTLVNELIEQIKILLDDKPGLAESLNAKLKNVIEFIDSNKIIPSINKLEAFISYVDVCESQDSPDSIDKQTAIYLKEVASDALNSLMNGSYLESKAIILTVDGLSFTKIFKNGEQPDYRPAYLYDALMNEVDLGIPSQDIYSFGEDICNGYNSSSNNNSWSGDANYTEKYIIGLIEQMKCLYDKAKNSEKKFIVVSHSWGTVLSYLALGYLQSEYDIEPDLFITLSTPLGSNNNDKYLAESFEVKLYKPIVDDILETISPLFIDLQTVGSMQSYISFYIAKQELDVYEKISSEMPYLSFQVPKAGQWINYWAMGDIISGPLNIEGVANIKLDSDSTIRTFENMCIWHAITSMSEQYWDKVGLSQYYIGEAEKLRDIVAENIISVIDN